MDGYPLSQNQIPHGYGQISAETAHLYCQSRPISLHPLIEIDVNRLKWYQTKYPPSSNNKKSKPRWIAELTSLFRAKLLDFKNFKGIANGDNFPGFVETRGNWICAIREAKLALWYDIWINIFECNSSKKFWGQINRPIDYKGLLDAKCLYFPNFIKNHCNTGSEFFLLGQINLSLLLSFMTSFLSIKSGLPLPWMKSYTLASGGWTQWHTRFSLRWWMRSSWTRPYMRTGLRSKGSRFWIKEKFRTI